MEAIYAPIQIKDECYMGEICPMLMGVAYCVL